MGAFLSKLRTKITGASPSNKTIAKLTTLQTDIAKLEKKRLEVKNSQKVLLNRMIYLACSLTLTYAILAYTILPSLLIAWIDSREHWLHFLALWSPVVIIPVFYFFAKKSAVKWYNWRINRWDRKLKVKRKSKLEILDNVMEVETYNNAMKIFEQFDRSRLGGAPKINRRVVENDKSTVRQRVNNVHPLVEKSSVKYHGFSRNETKAGLDKDSIRNMAMNYTFSGKSTSNSTHSDRLNTTFTSSSRYSSKKPEILASESKSGDYLEQKTTKKDSKKDTTKLGPAAPSLDESALKALTKGLVGKKKKSEKKTEKKSKKKSDKLMEKSTESIEKKSTEEEKAIDEIDPEIIEENNSDNIKPEETGTSKVVFTSPRTKELREAKSKIQELQDEIERLKAIEEEKNNSITVVGKLPNKALTRSSTNSSRAEMILRAKKIEKQHTKSKLVIEKQLRKSATQESNLSGMIAELPDSEDENEIKNNLSENINSENINSQKINSHRPSQSSLMTDQSDAENEDNEDSERAQNGTVVQEQMTDDEQLEDEDQISENDEGRGNSNEDNTGDNSLENVDNSPKQNNVISDDELLESEEDAKMVLSNSTEPDVQLMN